MKNPSSENQIYNLDDSNSLLCKKNKFGKNENLKESLPISAEQAFKVSLFLMVAPISAQDDVEFNRIHERLKAAKVDADFTLASNALLKWRRNTAITETMKYLKIFIFKPSPLYLMTLKLVRKNKKNLFLL